MASNNAAAKSAYPLPRDVHAALKRQLAPKEQGGLGKTQAQVAAELGLSSPVVNQLLKDSYNARTDRHAERIRGQYMRAVVQCPMWGQISTRHCQDERARPVVWSNPKSVQLHRCCSACTHNPNRKEAA